MQRLATAIFIAFAWTACGGSILIRRDDTTYLRSSRRLARTLASLPTATPREDLAEFLQGEALYRYRFEAPPRSFGSYLAQGAAVAFDFPALQSLAGSLDLYNLRLRVYDGAVHVWESLLERRPDTLLRPFVLYRLGWAYRNVIAPGFPRGRDNAWEVLVREHADSPLVRLAREAKATPYRSPGVATAWSVVPGLGQMYVGEYANGAVRLGVALASAAAIVVPALIAFQRRDELTWSEDWPLLATGLGGIIVLSIDYSLSYEDALRGAIQFNERVEARFEDAHPDAP